MEKLIEFLLGNIYIQSFIIGLILAAFLSKLLRRTNLNEPPLVYYRFPIIGHTWSFLKDCDKLILESREKYGETFSLYVYGQIRTIVGKESTHEVLRKDQDFSFRQGNRSTQLPTHLIFKQATLADENIIIIRDFIAGKLKQLISRLQNNIINAIDLHIGECVEPKVIRYPRKTLMDIIAIPIADIIVGERIGEIIGPFTYNKTSSSKFKIDLF
ncbi:cytochrome P450 [Gigaspora margarita]|uniref:Cytochrome P450 n=1 Tax=Gigaspora margarita TaxID=4874 RepID=A0A8H4B4K3_GIGMA|nr:cytochrome P450 [Gigaspora margarita]